MKVKLSNIRSATPRVRKELDLEKLDELAESIRETGGVIVPVKLKANGEGGFITVYGHRRIDACRLAGLTEIEAFVVDVDDEDLLTQALIENVVREDMIPLDIAKAFKQIKDETGWTNSELDSKFGVRSADYLGLLKMEEKVSRETLAGLGVAHVREAKAGTKNDADAVRVLEKTAAEELSTRQTRKVADAISAAPNPEAKEKLLEHEYSPFVHDADRIKEQSKRTPGRDPLLQEAKPKADATWRKVPEVASMLESLGKIEKDLVPSFIKLVEIGKLDPSGHTFVAGKVRRTIRAFEKFLDVL